jgi:hypothetical protein
MTFGSDIRKSKYGINAMEVGEVQVFDAPEAADKRRIRRAAHNQNERSDRHYATAAEGDVIYVTRVR